jgi:hypothetical protein
MLIYIVTDKIWSDLINLFKTKLGTGHIFTEQFKPNQKSDFDYNMNARIRKIGTGKNLKFWKLTHERSEFFFLTFEQLTLLG